MTNFDYQAVADQLRKDLPNESDFMLPTDYIALSAVRSLANALERVGFTKHTPARCEEREGGGVQCQLNKGHSGECYINLELA